MGVNVRENNGEEFKLFSSWGFLLFFKKKKKLFILGDLTHAPCSESKEEILTAGLPGNFLSWSFRIDNVPEVNVRA